MHPPGLGYRSQGYHSAERLARDRAKGTAAGGPRSQSNGRIFDLADVERAAGQMDDQPRVVDNPAQGRYELSLGERLVGFSAYVVRPARIVFTHTEVDGAYEGQGLGSMLARGALDDVRLRGLRVTPRCPFIAAYIRRHPEYEDLIAETGGA